MAGVGLRKRTMISTTDVCWNYFIIDRSGWLAAAQPNAIKTEPDPTIIKEKEIANPKIQIPLLEVSKSFRDNAVIKSGRLIRTFPSSLPSLIGNLGWKRQLTSLPLPLYYHVLELLQKILKSV